MVDSNKSLNKREGLLMNPQITPSDRFLRLLFLIDFCDDLIILLMLFYIIIQKAMNTQIAIPIDIETKVSLQKNLKRQGLTTKAFILSCIYAFNTGNLTLGIISQPDPDTYLTPEEKINFNSALKRYKNSDIMDFDLVMREI